MDVEVLQMAEGVLTLVRQNGKLVGSTYSHNPTIKIVQEREEMRAILGDSDPERCFYCGTWVDLFENGSYYDFADHFLCRQSPTSMHRPMPVDDCD